MTVLVAYDGKQHTQKALDYALKYAKSFSEKLYVVSVFPSKKFIPEMDVIKERTDALKAEAEKNGVELIALTEAGQPSTVILECAKRLSCSVIVVGRADNKTGFDRVVLGSVSNHVVSNAECTVIVVQ